MWKKVVLGLATICLAAAAAFGIFTYRIANDVREFRRHPGESRGRELLTAAGFGGMIGRYFVFEPGAPSYMADLRNWIYHSPEPLLADDALNRYLLERDVAAMSVEELDAYLHLYPLTPGEALLPYLRSRLEEAGRTEMLAVLARIPGGTAADYLRRWYTSAVVEPRDLDFFRDAARYLATGSPLSPEEVLDPLLREIEERQRGGLMWEIAQRVPADGGDGSLLSWLDHALEQGALTSASAMVLIGRYLADPDHAAAAKLLLERHLEELPGSAAHDLLELGDVPMAIVTDLFHRSRNANPALAAELLHAVAHRDVLAAEGLAADVLAGPDSVLRKSAIVLLVRHGSSLGERHIDEAFSGEAPRRTMFARTSEYIYGSRAADEYRRLARHDYEETGKQWPPDYLLGTPTAEDIPRWRDFIERYPWFPGTDDAYYHLAYLQLVFGEPAAAVETVLEALRRELPDRDAVPLLVHVLERVPPAGDAEASLTGHVAALHLQEIRQHPLGALVFSAPRDLTALWSALDWFAAQPRYQPLVSPEPRDLDLLRRGTAIVVHENSIEERLRQLDQLLAPHEDSIFCVLYGQCHLDRQLALDETMTGPLPGDRHELIERAIDLIKNQELWREGNDAWPEHRLRWTLLHAQTGRRWQLWSELEELRKLDRSGWPDSLRARYHQVSPVGVDEDEWH